MTNDFLESISKMKAKIPAHLDAEELIANTLDNCSDVAEEDQVSCFESTVLMYIDADCSSFE